MKHSHTKLMTLLALLAAAGGCADTAPSALTGDSSGAVVPAAQSTLREEAGQSAAPPSALPDRKTTGVGSASVAGAAANDSPSAAVAGVSGAAGTQAGSAGSGSGGRGGIGGRGGGGIGGLGGATPTMEPSTPPPADDDEADDDG